jgi:asparagine synthase (glutamine-hydrolysing)
MNNQNGYIPSFFLGIFCPRRNTSDENRLQDEFVSIAKTQPNISIATKSFIISLVHSKAATVAIDHENDVTLLLHGEIYNTTQNDKAAFLLDQYVKLGIDFSKYINGSFVVLLIDKRNDTVYLITDRINSRKVFYSKYKGNYWLSTSLSVHPTSNVDVDPLGVAYYLANGVIHNNRTLFDGIRILERASIHRLTQDMFCRTRYWSYEFTNSSANIDQKELSVELESLLVDAVRIRLNGNPEVFLSLSGGYDATGILGILGSKLNVPNVHCFSYGLGDPKLNSDEHVSRLMASILGFDHRVVKSYKGNFLDVVSHNANLGQGISHFCDEVDAWIEMANDFSAASPSVLFVADECFGWTDCELYSNIDVLNSLSINDSHGLRCFRNILPKGAYDMLYNGLNKDILLILRRCSLTEDYHDLKDFLYLDQRLNNLILPWREFFAGQFITVCNPFLDNSILDFMMKIPIHLRRGKYLYKQTITEMFPGLFQFKRAQTSSYVPDWRNELNLQLSAIETSILSQDSKLDKIIPPEIILQLLYDNTIVPLCFEEIAVLPIKIARRMLRGTCVGRKLIDRFSNVFEKRIDRTTLLKRILVMRLVLS